MFICKECLEKNYKNEPTVAKSFGRCDHCELEKECSDIASSNLIIKLVNPEAYSMEEEKDAVAIYDIKINNSTKIIKNGTKLYVIATFPDIIHGDSLVAGNAVVRVRDGSIVKAMMPVEIVPLKSIKINNE